MTIKKAYYYLYYKIYKMWDKVENPFLSTNLRADISMIFIMIWFIVSLFAYLSIMLGRRIELDLTKPIGLILAILVLGLTLYFFTFSTKKKDYFIEFEQWPVKKNRLGGLIVVCIVIFILVNLFVSIDLMKKLNG
jgi:membrane protease YdiL (CAAX protease family)